MNPPRSAPRRSPGPRLRLNATLVGDYVRIWHDEKSRGGSDGQVLMRLIDRAVARSMQQSRHEVYEQLQAIKLLATEIRLVRNPEVRQSIAALDAAADRIRSLVGRMDGH